MELFMTKNRALNLERVKWVRKGNTGRVTVCFGMGEYLYLSREDSSEFWAWVELRSYCTFEKLCEE
jgi:hypothetical protein